MRSRHGISIAALVLACGNAPDTNSLRPDTAHGEVSAALPEIVGYATIDSIFQARCVSCHGSAAPAPAHGVDLSSYASVMQGRAGRGPIVTVGNPAASVLIDALRGSGGTKRDSSAHRATALSVPPGDIAATANWISAGAQPTGTETERQRATLRLYVVALVDAEDGFYSWRRRYTASIDSLRIIPADGIGIEFLHADTSRWEARITHPRLRESCLVSGRVRAPARQLDIESAAAFCNGAP
jgi:hypothetical protein